MTPAERRALIGDAAIEEIKKSVAQAPPPTPDLLAQLRAIFAPTMRTSRTAPADSAEQHAA